MGETVWLQILGLLIPINLGKRKANSLELPRASVAQGVHVFCVGPNPTLTLVANSFDEALQVIRTAERQSVNTELALV